MKTALRSLASRCGYAIRHVGTGVTGVDLMHDLRLRIQADAPVIFDIGANTGQTIAEALTTFPRAQITAFEPSPQSVDALRSRFPHVSVEPIAMSDQRGTATLHVSDEWSVNDSLLTPADGATGTITVPTETVNTYCANRHIGHLDWLKIDTQGFDLQVLRGSNDLLSRQAVAVVTCEVMLVPMYAGQATMPDVLTFMASLHYDLAGIYDQTFWHNRLAYLNLCFTPHLASGS